MLTITKILQYKHTDQRRPLNTYTHARLLVLTEFELSKYVTDHLASSYSGFEGSIMHLFFLLTLIFCLVTCSNKFPFEIKLCCWRVSAVQKVCKSVSLLLLQRLTNWKIILENSRSLCLHWITLANSLWDYWTPLPSRMILTVSVLWVPLSGHPSLHFLQGIILKIQGGWRISQGRLKWLSSTW